MSLNIKRLFNHNYKKYIVGGFFISGFVLLLKYGQYKFNEWRKQEVQQILLRSKRRQHYESIEKSCNQTIINLSKYIKQSVLKILDSATVIQNLKDSNCDKLYNWNKLKIYSVCRTVVIIYANTMLAMILRIQLSLTSAYMFKKSQKTSEVSNLDDVVQQQYMALSSYFVEDGIEHLITLVKEKVEDILKSVSLTEKRGIKELEQMYWSITSIISADKENDPIKNLINYVFPPHISSPMSPALEKILNPTLDLLESQEVQYLMQSNIRSGFVLLLDRISENFIHVDVKECTSSTSENLNGNIFTELNNITVPIAKIIPMLDRQVELSATDDLHSVWVQTLISDEKFRNFGANVYEAFSF